MVSQPGQTFIGRSREMAELRSALEDALAGRGRVVMLAGEPGIGKTRTAQQLAEAAQGLGAQILWGWCYEREGAPPYCPWVEPVRAKIRASDADMLRSQMGPGASDISEVIPEVLEKLPELESSPTLDPDQARFRLFDSFAAFLKNSAHSQPMMIVLDDLHWADRPSLLLLEFLARQISDCPMLLVGTYRDVEITREHPMSETLVRLYRSPLFQSITLVGLDTADVGPFVQAAIGADAPEELVEAIYARTEGNRLFMSEVIRLLGGEGGLDGAAGTGTPETLAISPSVFEVIGQQLNRLSETGVQMLTTASIVGREFDFQLLRDLETGTSEDLLLAALEESLETRLIQEVAGEPERFRFTHALIQQTLEGRLSAIRRGRMHARIGEALEGIYGASAGGRAAELAHHFAQAAPVLGPEKLVKYSLLAGEQALSAYAYEDAEVYFQNALSAKDDQVTDPETADLSFGLGRAQAATLGRQHLDVAFANLRRAFEFYAETDDVERAIAIAGYPMLALAGQQGGVELVARALQLVDPDSHEAGGLWSRYVLLREYKRGITKAPWRRLKKRWTSRENSEMWRLS